MILYSPIPSLSITATTAVAGLVCMDGCSLGDKTTVNSSSSISNTVSSLMVISTQTVAPTSLPAVRVSEISILP